jgi:uncharacterized membrane protein YkoI
MKRQFATLALILAAGTGLAFAGDHDRAREALEAGQIQSLRQILDTVERNHPGQVVEVELDREDGTWVYEVKLLRNDGSRVKLEVDARDGSVLRTSEKKEKR